MAAADKVDPIHQFHINKIVPIEIGGYDLSFTNSSLFMVVTVLVASAFLYLATSGRHLVPTRWQSSAELTYEFIANMLKDSAGRYDQNPERLASVFRSAPQRQIYQRCLKDGC